MTEIYNRVKEKNIEAKQNIFMMWKFSYNFLLFLTYSLTKKKPG